MFDGLSQRLESTLRRLRGQGKIRESNIQEALAEVRTALLEADVNLDVVKGFVDAVKDKAMGGEVLESLTPGQQFIKTVHRELIALLGGEFTDIDLAARPPVPLMLVGLQGAGKTTTAGKLARYLKAQGREPMLVSTDVRRPAAMLQLERLGERIGVKVFKPKDPTDPVAIARAALKEAEVGIEDVLILDTAGRLHIDDELMHELDRLKSAILPQEILLVADAMTGQDAVQVARSFNERLDLDGVILTKLDGDARGGAALSIKSVTGKPIKLVGMGENMEALEPFHPDRMASRILGMGDILSFIEKAERVVDEKTAVELERKIQKNTFTIEDFRDQLVALKQMGSIDQLAGMIPGLNRLTAGKDLSGANRELSKIEAIINSMTKQERVRPGLLNASRRRRIAVGSGTGVADVNRFLKQYDQMTKLMKRMASPGGRIFQGMRLGARPH